VSAILSSLSQTGAQLKNAEGQCWTSIIPRVCANTPAKDGTCSAVDTGGCSTAVNGDQSCSGGATLKVATSTAFSQAVVTSQITPLNAAASANVAASRQALQLINTLIQGVTNTASLNAQRVALQQLDTLVAQHKLHTQSDLATVTQQQSGVASTMSTLLQTVAQNWSGTGTSGSGNAAWDGTANPGVCWCNVNNSATLQAWTQTWKK
jgi:hypothetical protein